MHSTRLPCCLCRFFYYESFCRKSLQSVVSVFTIVELTADASVFGNLPSSGHSEKLQLYNTFIYHRY